MRSLSIGLVAAALAAMITAGSAGAALAQDSRGIQPPKRKSGAAPPDPAAAKAQGMAEAPPLLQQAGVVCTVSDAAAQGAGKTDVDGAKVDTKFYEVACSDGPGYIVIAPEGKPVKAYNCLGMAQAVATNPGQLVCTLPANAQTAGTLQPILTKAGARCTPSQARWAGMSAENKIDLYEVGCSEGGAYVLQVPQAGSTRTLLAVNCLRGASAGIECQYVTKAQALETITKAAAGANRPACQVNDMRFMGATKSNTEFFELGCADGKSGYVIEVDAGGKFVKAVTCGLAVNIGGGCQFTAVEAAGGENATYTKLLTGMGYPCTVEKYRPIGLDPATNREIIEMICSGKPAAQVALIPTDKGQKGEVWNCARAEGRSLKCMLAPIAPTYAVMTQQITAASKECTVNKTRFVGASTEGSEYVEVGCAGGGALMIEYGQGLEVVKAVYNCSEAKKIGGGCKFLTP